VSNLRACGPLTYTDNERAKNSCMLLMIICGGMKITAFEASADFATLDIEKLFSKLKLRNHVASTLV
jgi:hypothetical protein